MVPCRQPGRVRAGAPRAGALQGAASRLSHSGHLLLAVGLRGEEELRTGRRGALSAARPALQCAPLPRHVAAHGGLLREVRVLVQLFGRAASPRHTHLPLLGHIPPRSVLLQAAGQVVPAPAQELLHPHLRAERREPATAQKPRRGALLAGRRHPLRPCAPDSCGRRTQRGGRALAGRLRRQGAGLRQHMASRRRDHIKVKG